MKNFDNTKIHDKNVKNCVVSQSEVAFTLHTVKSYKT